VPLSTPLPPSYLTACPEISLEKYDRDKIVSHIVLNQKFSYRSIFTNKLVTNRMTNKIHDI
jgi:hypothetical protein